MERPAKANTRALQGQQATEDNDADSAIETTYSSTASITSTILNYRTLLGRRYHSEIGNAKYWYGIFLSSSITLCKRRHP